MNAIEIEMTTCGNVGCLLAQYALSSFYSDICVMLTVPPTVLTFVETGEYILQVECIAFLFQQH